MMIIGVVLLVGGVLFVVWPMLSDAREESKPAADAQDGRLPSLIQIEDLDLEYAAGKIPEASYQKVRNDLIREAASELQPAVAPAPETEDAAFKKCSSCGTKIESKDQFCFNCGGTL